MAFVEVKQGIDTIIKFKPGAEPTSPVSSSAVPAFRDSLSLSFDIPITKIFSTGFFSHFKKGVPSGGLNMGFRYAGRTELKAFEQDVANQSVPSGYLELHFLGVTRAVEHVIKVSKVARTSISYSNPTEDIGTASLDVTHGEVPTPIKPASALLQ